MNIVPHAGGQPHIQFSNQFSMSHLAIETLRKDPADNPHAKADAAITLVRSGFPVAHLKVNDKYPPGGWEHATTDYETIRDQFIDEPDGNVGVAGEPHRVYADIDERHDGTLERAAALGIPTAGFRYRTPGGWRVPLLIPDGIKATRSAKIAPGIEIIGPGKGVVVPHSVIDGNWYKVEPDRNIWTWAAIPERWEHLDPLTKSTLPTSSDIEMPTAEDHQKARDVIDSLLKSRYQRQITAILAGNLQEAGYPSRSEADAALAFMATHHLRNNERTRPILFALLEQHSRKAKTHKTPTKYIQTQVRNVIIHRDRQDEARLSDLRSLLAGSLRCTFPNSPLGGVTDPKDIPGRGEKSALIEAIVAFAAYVYPDDYARPDGWRRLPVRDFAQLFATTPENVRLALVDAKERGLIERGKPAYKHDGKFRRDSLVRLVSLSSSLEVK